MVIELFNVPYVLQREGSVCKLKTTHKGKYLECNLVLSWLSKRVDIGFVFFFKTTSLALGIFLGYQNQSYFPSCCSGLYTSIQES